MINFRRLNAQQRLRQQRAQAQRYIEAIHQALEDLGFPDTLVAEIGGRLQAQQQLLGKIVGIIHELTRVRGWNKNIPTRLLSALPKRAWLKRLRRLGLEILISIWRHTQDQSASTQSRWQWRWVVDDSVFRKYGKSFRLVGRWWSGQFKHPVAGIDGVLVLVVLGDGKLIIPVDFAIRRPNPKGPGAHCIFKFLDHVRNGRLPIIPDVGSQPEKAAPNRHLIIGSTMRGRLLIQPSRAPPSSSPCGLELCVRVAELVKRARQPNAGLHRGQHTTPWNLFGGECHLAP